MRTGSALFAVDGWFMSGNETGDDDKNKSKDELAKRMEARRKDMHEDEDIEDDSEDDYGTASEGGDEYDELFSTKKGDPATPESPAKSINTNRPTETQLPRASSGIMAELGKGLFPTSPTTKKPAEIPKGSEEIKQKGQALGELLKVKRTVKKDEITGISEPDKAGAKSALETFLSKERPGRPPESGIPKEATPEVTPEVSSSLDPIAKANRIIELLKTDDVIMDKQEIANQLYELANQAMSDEVSDQILSIFKDNEQLINSLPDVEISDEQINIEQKDRQKNIQETLEEAKQSEKDAEAESKQLEDKVKTLRAKIDETKKQVETQRARLAELENSFMEPEETPEAAKPATEVAPATELVTEAKAEEAVVPEITPEKTAPKKVAAPDEVVEARAASKSTLTPYADIMSELRGRTTTPSEDKRDESEILKTQYEKTGIAGNVRNKVPLNAQEQEIKDRYDAMMAMPAATPSTPDPVKPVKTDHKGDVDSKSPGADTQTRPPLKALKEDEKWFGHRGPLETLAIILSGNRASPFVNMFLRRPLDYLVGSPLQAVGLAALGTASTARVWLNSALGDAEGIKSAQEYRASCFLEAGYNLYSSFPVDAALLVKDLVTLQGNNAWNERNLTLMLRGKPFVNALATREALLANFDINTGGVLHPNKKMTLAEMDMHEKLRKIWNKDHKQVEKVAVVDEYFKKSEELNKISPDKRTKEQTNKLSTLADRAANVIDEYVKMSEIGAELEPRKLQDIKNAVLGDNKDNAICVAFNEGKKKGFFAAIREEFKLEEPLPPSPKAPNATLSVHAKGNPP